MYETTATSFYHFELAEDTGLNHDVLVCDRPDRDTMCGCVLADTLDDLWWSLVWYYKDETYWTTVYAEDIPF